MTFNNKEYEFRDFDTLRMRVTASTYYNMYQAACKKLEEAIKDEKKPDYETLGRLSASINVAFSMFINEALKKKTNRFNFWTRKFIGINYFDCKQEEVTALVGSFFAGLTASIQKPSE